MSLPLWFVIVFVLLVIIIIASIVILFLLNANKTTVPKAGITNVLPNTPTPVGVATLPFNAIGSFSSQKVGKETSVFEWLLRYDGACLRMPLRWIPDPQLLIRKLAIVSKTTT